MSANDGQRPSKNCRNFLCQRIHCFTLSEMSQSCRTCYNFARARPQMELGLQIGDYSKGLHFLRPARQSSQLAGSSLNKTKPCFSLHKARKELHKSFKILSPFGRVILQQVFGGNHSKSLLPPLHSAQGENSVHQICTAS